jgi:hypothetical protein
MFDVLLFLGFSSLIVRFKWALSRTIKNIDAVGEYVREAQKELHS